MRTNKKKSGFTLVEILIVVVILGILAAIVIPQFSQASTEARENSLRADLQTVRSQIELFKIQHSDNLPGFGSASWVECMTDTSGTDIDGTLGGAYGPYLQQVPINPFNDLRTVDVAGGTLGDGLQGWMFNTTTGAFNADDDDVHKLW